MTSKHRTVVSVAVISLALLAAHGVLADGPGGTRRAGHRQALPDHVAAFAALEPLGDVTGWGRIVVRDEIPPSGPNRAVTVWLFGLEPGSSYRVEVGGVSVGEVGTDPFGDGYLKLQTGGEGQQNVPDGLPPAGDIVSASVFDSTLAAVLEGTFSTVRQQIEDGAKYEEKIELEDAAGGPAMGMACVRVMESGTQRFTTRASRLEPGLSYRILVDRFLAGVVTADAEGQAVLELAAPSDDNPMPSELQPVTEIVTVEWYHEDLPVLVGSFDGEIHCESVRGTLVELADDGFLLQVGDRVVEVSLGDRARYIGFEDLEDLGEGDLLKVEGCFEDDAFIAEFVALLADADGPECVEARGTVARIGVDEFLVHVEDRELVVVVTDETRLEGFESLNQLGEGDLVAFEGCFDGDLLYAAWVSLLEDADVPECLRVEGTFIEHTDRGFLMLVGEDDRVSVIVTEDTHLKEFDRLEDLEVGDLLKAEGCLEDGALVAEWVWLLSDEPEPECLGARGAVIRVGVDELLVRVEDRELVVVVTDETRLKEFESLEQLGEGDLVAFEGCFDGDLLYAAWVMLLEDADAPECLEARGTVLSVGVDELLVRVEDRELVVVVTDETRLEGFESVEQLGEGDLVAFEGCFDGDLLYAAWVMLLEDADAPECLEARGTVLEVGGDGFVVTIPAKVIGRDIRVVVTGDTVFDGFESLEQLGEGDLVAFEGCFDGDLLYAAWVVLVEDADAPEWWEVSGPVVELFEDGFAMNTGEEMLRVFVTAETEYREVAGLVDIGVGDTVFVEGPCDGESIEAAVVMLIEAAA